MIQQAGLFDHAAPIASAKDPWTSHEAANDLTRSGIRAEQKLQVLKALRQYPGSTSAELAAKSGMDRYRTARRLPDLRADGLVTNGMPQQCKPCSVTGKMALIWNPV
jgi:hypothetical protein